MSDGVRSLAESGIRSRLPDYTEQEGRNILPLRIHAAKGLPDAGKQVLMIVGNFPSRLIRELEKAIPYTLTNSLASSFHGLPHTTHDIDIVIDPTRNSLKALLAMNLG